MLQDKENASKNYQSSNELYKDLSRLPVYAELQGKERSYMFQFSLWLTKNKGYELGNYQEYLSHLNEQTFAEFWRALKIEKEIDKQREEAELRARNSEAERLTDISHLRITGTNEPEFLIDLEAIKKNHEEEQALLSQLKNHEGETQPKQNNSNSVKSFPEYLLHENREKLAEKIRSEFKTEKDKDIRLLIEALLHKNPPLISIPPRGKQKLLETMTSFFKRSIGVRQSVWDYPFNYAENPQDLKPFTDRLNFILSSISKGKKQG